MRHVAAAFTATLLAASSVFAAGDMQPLMTVRGKQLMNEEFSKPAVPVAFKVAKGTWTIDAGALKGVELASDQHAAVVRTDLPVTNGIFQFDFKFTPAARGAHLSLNDTSGHVCRVSITPQGFSVRKDGSKKDKSDVGKELDSCRIDFKPGEWYTMIVEIQGEEIIARVDDQHFAFGSDPKVAREKTNFGFPSSGDGVYFDNVKIWEAAANPAWPAIKAKLAAAHPAKLTPAAPKGKAKKNAK